ncbi:hypothetical protein C0991_012265 [Blastosporella zonata]|nr:hypothetical protein C0991_012265 [Blastosporella zonata]
MIHEPNHIPLIVYKPILVEQTLRLRHSVLWPNMPLSHVSLPEDAQGLHIGAFLPDADQPVAVISVFVEPSPINHSFIRAHDTQRQARFRKFACDPAFQGRGIGTKLLEFAFKCAREDLNATVAWCDARTSSADWYAKRGMTPFGDTFFKGPVEYIMMYIDLVASDGAS